MSELPLAGKRVLVTRRAEQSAALAAGLSALGAEVLEAPLIEVQPPLDAGPLDRELARLEQYAWVAFTSANAVHFVRNRMDALGLAPNMLGEAVRVASVGPSTTKALRSHFPEAAVSLEPDGDFRAEGLLRAFLAHPVAGLRVLQPVSDRAREVIATGLRERGAVVEMVVAYRTVLPQGAREELAETLGRGVDLVLFASPSAVENFLAAAGVASVPAAVMGPVTEQAARAAGLDVRVVASPSTAQGLLAAVRGHFAP